VSQGVAIAVGVAAYLVLMGGLIGWRVRKGLSSTPWHVVRVLTEEGGPFEVKVAALGGTWNPAKPLGSGNISGPGVGVYRLEESGEVHLTWTPKRGVAREFSGPIPDRVRPDSEQTVRMRRTWHRFLYVYVTMLAAGFVVGLVVAGGSTLHRLAGGGIGVFVAIAVMAIGGTVLSAVRSFRPKHDVRP